MGITFHCSYCNKKINAKDNDGGKWGKCPSCHNKIYIPDTSSGEDLKLTPVDKKGEETKKKLMAETYKLELDILSQREIPDELAGPSTPDATISDEELTKNIIVCLRKMADGELEQAEGIVGSITVCSKRAIEILDRIALSEIPEPELSDIPPQVLSGLIRTLRSKIN